MNNIVEFNGNQLKVIENNCQRCLTATDIARALGFEKVKSVSNIYTRHADEFEGLSWVINLMTETQSYQNRVFNREGAWLIGMFARTPKAAEFRKWVLRVLGAVADNQIAPAAVDMKAIGGLVKRCVNKALMEFLSNDLPMSDENDVLRQKYYNVSDKDMAETLQRWYWSRNYDVRQALNQSAQRIEELEAKLRMVKKAIN